MTALSIVLGPHGQVADLKSGAVTVDGIDLDFITVKRMPDAYRDMARTQPYAISEMAPTAYLMALAQGAPLTALPIPMTRRFRHGGIMVPENSPVSGPQDLPGKAVGVRAYAVTAAVWTRGILAEDYGLDPDTIAWRVAEDDNLDGFTPPPNVASLPDTQSMAEALAKGQLAAAFDAMAGLGNDHGLALRDLVPDRAARERDFFARTGIYPIHGVIVLRNDVIDAVPDIGARLFRAFAQAKDNYWRRVIAGSAQEAEDLRYRKLAAIVGDPLPYGLFENRASLTALVRYAHEQGLIDRQPAIERCFLDPETAHGRKAEWR